MAKEPDHSEQKRPKQFNAYLKYSGLAIQLVATIGVSGWLGYWLDNYLELKYPIFIILFTLSAFTGVMYHLYRSINNQE